MPVILAWEKMTMAISDQEFGRFMQQLATRHAELLATVNDQGLRLERAVLAINGTVRGHGEQLASLKTAVENTQAAVDDVDEKVNNIYQQGCPIGRTQHSRSTDTRPSASVTTSMSVTKPVDGITVHGQIPWKTLAKWGGVFGGGVAAHEIARWIVPLLKSVQL